MSQIFPFEELKNCITGSTVYSLMVNVTLCQQFAMLSREVTLIASFLFWGTGTIFVIGTIFLYARKIFLWSNRE